AAGLDAAVRRGLERHRDRRWRNLNEFRDALLPFVPRTLPDAGIGLRIGAYILDFLPFWLLSKIAGAIVLLIMGVPRGDRVRPFLVTLIIISLLIRLTRYGYFILAEGRWGNTIGKRLLHLRVVSGARSAEPGLQKGALRGALFFGLVDFIPTALVIGILWFTGLPRELTAESAAHSATPVIDVDFGNINCFNVLGLAILMSTMRRKNGFRMLHDFASDTRVVRLPWPERRRSLGCTTTRPIYSHADGLPGNLGRFEIAGAINRQAESQ